MKITLYTTHCPKCKVIETKLNKAGIEYTTIDDIDTITKIGEDNHILSAPILLVDGDFFAFKEANDFVNQLIK